jgi:hypothetical protein
VQALDRRRAGRSQILHAGRDERRQRRHGAHRDEPRRRVVGELSQHDAIDNRVDRRGGADAKRQRQGDADREQRPGHETAHSDYEVADEITERHTSPRRAQVVSAPRQSS